MTASIKKFAIVQAVIVENGDKQQLRYVLWEKTTREHEDVSVSRVVLTYDSGEMLEDILNKVNFTFNIEGRAEKQVFAEGDDYNVYCAAGVNTDLNLPLTYLGLFNDYECYAFMPQKARSVDIGRSRVTRVRFSIKEMPIWGVSSVVYTADTVRESFNVPNITDTVVVDQTRTIELFNYIDTTVRKKLKISDSV